MITHLSGKLVEKNPTDVVIDCNGVGYAVQISLHTYSMIPEGARVQLFTYMHVKEDSQTLYGFVQKSEREVFKLLISVSGVGTSTARTMLSSLSADEVKQAIATGNVPVIQSVKGIGAKTAQRIILDLKDKILKVFDIDEVSQPMSNTNKEEALSALETLGFARKQAETVCSRIVRDDPGAGVETIIKQALKNL
jgi:Holliday junction DNA helicase RuvA